MPDWKLTKHTPVCAACEREFEDDEPLFSLLAFETEEVRREDVCRACFPAREESAGTHLIFWRSRHRIGKKAFQVDFEALEGLFLALEGRDEVELRELRYLLSLLLMRKKRVKLLKTARKDDGEAMILRRPRRTEELVVYVFDLTPERSEILRGKLRAIFEGADLEELLTAPAAAAPEDEAQDEGDGEAGGDPASEDAPPAEAAEPSEPAR